MTIALVHGVPETSAVWDLLVDELVALGHDEPLRLSPPGFGAPVPDGWAATADDYTAWLVGELENIGHPVDLVGHDWGGGHVLNVAITRPELIRTWVSDVTGTYHEDYVWPGLVEQWQTPGVGEQVIAAMTAQPAEEGAAFLAGAGMHPVIAQRVAPGIDEVMGACILRLYRSAVQPVLAELGKGLEAAAARPGLAILATEDHDVGHLPVDDHPAVGKLAVEQGSVLGVGESVAHSGDRRPRRLSRRADLPGRGRPSDSPAGRGRRGYTPPGRVARSPSAGPHCPARNGFRSRSRVGRCGPVRRTAGGSRGSRPGASRRSRCPMRPAWARITFAPQQLRLVHDVVRDRSVHVLAY